MRGARLQLALPRYEQKWQPPLVFDGVLWQPCQGATPPHPPSTGYPRRLSQTERTAKVQRAQRSQRRKMPILLCDLRVLCAFAVLLVSLPVICSERSMCICSQAHVEQGTANVRTKRHT